MQKASIFLSTVLALVLLFVAGGWYVDYSNRTHPAPWPMVQGDAAGRFATRATFPREWATLWSTEIGSSHSLSPVIGTDGSIYLLSGDQLLAFDEHGVKRWAWRSKSLLFAVALGRHGAIYTTGTEGIIALDLQGRVIWRLPLEITSWSRPLLVGQGGVIYVPTDSTLYAVNSDGTFKWTREWNNGENTWPIETTDGNVLFSDGRDLVALTPDGTESWSKRLGRTSGMALTAGPDGTVYYRSTGTLVILGSTDGRIRQEILRSVDKSFNLSVGKDFVQDGLTRFGEDGKPSWTHPISPATMALLTYTDGRGQLLVFEVGNASNGTTYRLSLRDSAGAELWQIDDYQVMSLPAIGRDGRICFAGGKSSEQNMALICIGQK